ncbi:MAG: tetratricopeptide repeat protein [Pseudomonadota bacterium]|nr:tetratricopeptide repeat protein [Pseudomonadota bacterium]
MIRFIFILISVFIVGFFIVKDTWMVTVQGFGYELKASILVFVVGACLVLYLLHLLKKPFGWWERCHRWLEKRNQNQKEAYLLLALKTMLDKNTVATQQIIKQKNKFFPKKSDENYVIEALFDPNTHVFEHLLHRESTELAGIRGLLHYAKAEGNLTEATRLLNKATEKYPNEPWIYHELWKVQILQNDWHEALNTLEKLKKDNQVNKPEYIRYKALLLLKLGRIKDAHKLCPTDQAIILAYARTEPDKAEKLIRNLWALAPCQEAFDIYWQALSAYKPDKQSKAVDKLVRENPKHKLSLLVLAQTAIHQKSWPMAKDYLTDYLSLYPLTAQVAKMMADVEQKGWNHTDEAQKWRLKALDAPAELGWECAVCGHQTESWALVCPVCHAFAEMVGE